MSGGWYRVELEFEDSLMRCPTCAALVLFSDEADHERWHASELIAAMNRRGLGEGS